MSVRSREWIGGALLFSATAAVIAWQALSVAVFWDLSFVLETAYRITLGQAPYRDFPFVYAPLTFVVQAAVIKLTGAVYWHHVVYCAIAGGLATLLTWRILREMLHGSFARSRLIAFLLSTPLVVLGIYSIYPFPSYDSDCTLAILVAILMLLYAEEKGFPSFLSFLAGASLVMPVFAKQNTGLAFLASATVALLALIVVDRRRRTAVRGYVTILCGVIAGLTIAAVLIHITVGVGNYLHWTIGYAADNRMPRRLLRWLVWTYSRDHWFLPSQLAIFSVGALLLAVRRKNRFVAATAAVALSVPYVAVVVSSHHFLLLWQFVLIVSFLTAVLAARRRTGMALMLPFIVIASVHGAFLSQGVEGSTDGLWPLAIILIASILAALANWSKQGSSAVASVSIVVTLSLLISGANYSFSHARLDYAHIFDGNLQHSALPALRGLTARGQWLPQFDELAAYATAEIPANDGLLIIPGEDPFYYATGRVPRTPVQFFDYTLNPDSPEQVAPMARAYNIRWIIVKRQTQVEVLMYSEADRQRLLELLSPECGKVKQFKNYDIYKCKFD